VATPLRSPIRVVRSRRCLAAYARSPYSPKNIPIACIYVRPAMFCNSYKPTTSASCAQIVRWATQWAAPPRVAAGRRSCARAAPQWPPRRSSIQPCGLKARKDPQQATAAPVEVQRVQRGQHRAAYLLASPAGSGATCHAAAALLCTQSVRRPCWRTCRNTVHVLPFHVKRVLQWALLASALARGDTAVKRALRGREGA
jgi:hypothetical protein